MFDPEIRQVNEEVLALGDLSQVDPKILDEVQEKIRTLLEKSAHSLGENMGRMARFVDGSKNR